MAASEQTLRIFVSHSHKDEVFCRPIVEALRQAGADVWYDRHDLGLGRLGPSIEREVESRPVFIVALSPTAITSTWVEDECRWAYWLARKDPTRSVLPIVAAALTSESDIWLFLRDFRRIEAASCRPYPRKQAIRRLLQILALTPPAAPPTVNVDESIGDLLTRGKALAAQGRYEEAAPLFQIAIEHAPRSSEAWFNLGRAHDALHHVAEAADAFEHARALDATAALEQLAEAMIVLDLDGQLRQYNPAALNYATNRNTVDEARTRGIRLEPDWRLFWLDGTLVPPEEHPARRAMITHEPISGAQMLVLREDATYTPILVNASPLRADEGEFSGTVMTFQDISALKEVERLKDEFISIASHELRQPLTVIQGQAQILRRSMNVLANRHPASADIIESMRRHVSGLESQTSRLNSLVSDLLDMSRIQTGQLRLEPYRVSLMDMVRHVVEQERGIAQGHTLRLTTHIPAKWRQLEGYWDPRRIEQIILNLLSNATKYSPAGGQVTIAISVLTPGRRSQQVTERGLRRVSGPAAHVLIRDQGIGIPPDALTRLCERFYRAHNTAGIMGTGLGLYICRQLAWAHDGDLWVDSGGVGQGATAHLVLPLLDLNTTPSLASSAGSFTVVERR